VQISLQSKSQRPYGPINQNAFVVPDIDAAIDRWTRIRKVGPFFKFPPIVFEEADYRGRPQVPDFEAAIAYSGELMIELIKPNGPSIFKEYLDAGHQGVHHFCAFTDDFEAASSAIEREGGKRLQGGRFADGSCLAYFDLGDPAPSILEIAYLMPPVLALFDAIKAAAASWNGHSRTVSF
jgi:hypothetical protein